ncbi:TlpA disulfide reductase family protein [Acidobacterium sp. S8]|uniref:TlpA family protein disulfide reductase n=1 Tax=Acidobacterium sp. S8 TaxID=1641854 RepID=UPI0027387E80|nr:TlpA disulfide reductase family protein [Acidobacterium sp. S8]
MRTISTLATGAFTRILRTIAEAAAISSLLMTAGCDRGSLPAQVAKQAPAFTIVDGSKTVRLSDYRGKIVVLNFWASWCAPCLEELPSLIALQKQMPQLVVLAVDFDDDVSAYHQFLIDNHVDLLTIHDESQRSNLAFGTTRPPETYIIDGEGKIRRKFIGPQDWTSPEITNYLKNI